MFKIGFIQILGWNCNSLIKNVIFPLNCFFSFPSFVCLFVCFQSMEKGSFQDGNPIEICCKLVVSMWFPICFPLREIALFTQCSRLHSLRINENKFVGQQLLLMVLKKISRAISRWRIYSNIVSQKNLKVLCLISE